MSRYTVSQDFVCPLSGPKKTKSGRSAHFPIGKRPFERLPFAPATSFVRAARRPAPHRVRAPDFEEFRGRAKSRARLRFLSPRNLSKIGRPANQVSGSGEQIPRRGGANEVAPRAPRW